MGNTIDEVYEETLEKLARDDVEAGKSLDYIADKFDEEYIIDMIDVMLDVSSDFQISDYKNRVCEISLNAWKTGKDFYEKYNRKWEAGLLRSQILWFICKDLLETTEKIEHPTYLHKSLRQLYIRACQVYYEVYVLVCSGLADGAWARWRTLYELAILAEFIAENGEEAAKGYFDSANDGNTYYEWARGLSCYADYNPKDQITFSSLVKRCKNMKRRWKHVYQTASVTVHACAKGTFYSFAGDGAECAGAGPQLYGSDNPAILAAESIAICSQSYLDLFSDLNICTYKETIFKWTKELKECYKELASANDET